MPTPEPTTEQEIDQPLDDLSVIGSPRERPQPTEVVPPSPEPRALEVSIKRFSKSGGRFSQSYVSPDYPVRRPNYWLAKRLFDAIAASAALLVLLPVFVVIAIAVTLDSPGSALFKQVRVGKGGRFFWCYKFRSMRANSEDMKFVLAASNELHGPVFKIKKDPRITRAGRLLRRTSLDELPQLVNVLLGDMSLVGPRPPLPSEVDQYTQAQRGRLSVLPGITCIWQVSGRSNVGFQDWMAMDLEYVEKMSFWLDIWLLLKTIPAVLSGRGAY
jgi:lipopolysaccharide/colanic/teichoic acid biosynthesis glycosyltransferase